MAKKRNKISFNKRLYHRGAVERAVKAFQKLAVSEIKEDKKNIAVFLEADLEEKNLNDEFANYVLAETVSGK